MRAREAEDVARRIVARERGCPGGAVGGADAGGGRGGVGDFSAVDDQPDDDQLATGQSPERRGELDQALANVLGTVVLGLLAVWAGLRVGHSV